MTPDNSTENRLLSQAVELHKGGFHAEARNCYAKILISNPSHLDALNLSGLLAFQTGELGEAVGYLRQAILLDPDFADAHYHLGLVHQAQGDPIQAVTCLEKARKLSPQDPDIQLKLAETLRVVGHFAQAVTILEGAVRDKPRNAGLLIELGRAYRDSGLLDDAAATFGQAIATAELVGQAELELGNLLRLVGRFDEAAAAFERAIAAQPDNNTARLQLGRTLTDWGKPEEALEVFRSVTEKDPNSQLFALLYGDTLLQCGQTEAAVDSLQKTAVSAPSNRRIQTLLGYALEQAGRTDEARHLWRQVLAAEADHLDALHHLANAARGNETLIQEAIELYQVALKHSPKNHELLIEFGRSLFILDRPRMAVEASDICLRQAPGNTSAIANKIIGLVQLGRHDDVRELADATRFIRPMRFTDAPGYDTLEGFNAALAEHVRAHPTLNFTPPEKSTRYGDHTGDLRFGLPRGPIDAFEAMIDKAVAAYRAGMVKNPAHPFLANFADRWGLTIWAIVMRSQGHQTPHIHPAGWLSGVYYPQVSNVVADGGGDTAGWIEFGRPPETYARAGDPEVTLYRPEEGLMLLFPSYIYHRTIPYEISETRISVAFDLFPVKVAEATHRPNLAKIVAPDALFRQE